MQCLTVSFGNSLALNTVTVREGMAWDIGRLPAHSPSHSLYFQVLGCGPAMAMLSPDSCYHHRASGHQRLSLFGTSCFGSSLYECCYQGMLVNRLGTLEVR